MAEDKLWKRDVFIKNYSRKKEKENLYMKNKIKYLNHNVVYKLQNIFFVRDLKLKNKEFVIEPDRLNKCGTN